MGENSPRTSSEPQPGNAMTAEEERKTKIQMEQDEIYARQLAIRLELGIDDDEPIPNTFQLQRSLLNLDSSPSTNLAYGNGLGGVNTRQRSNSLTSLGLNGVNGRSRTSSSINNDAAGNNNNDGNNDNNGVGDERRQTRMNAMNAMTRELRSAYINVILNLGVHIPQLIAGLIVLPLYWSDETPCSVDDRTKWKLYAVVALLRMVVKCYIVIETYRVQSYNDPSRLRSDYFHFIKSITNIEEGFALIWFIVGNMWLLSDDAASDGETSSCKPFTAPIYKLGFSFLMIQYFLLCLPCIIVILLLPVLCFCLPCLIRFMARFVDTNANKGATEESINKHTTTCTYREILMEESTQNSPYSSQGGNKHEIDIESGMGIDDTLQHSSEDALISRQSSNISGTSDIGSIQGKTDSTKNNSKRRRSSGFLETALDLVSSSTKNNNDSSEATLNGEQGDQDMNKPACAICIMDYEEDDIVRRLPCKHYFHKDCVDSWLKMNATCPTCRGNILGEANTDTSNTANSARESNEQTPLSSNNSSTASSNLRSINVNA